jgi:hypothetical protein
VCLKNISDCMRSHNGSIDTTLTPPPLSFYNTFLSRHFGTHLNTAYDKRGEHGGTAVHCRINLLVEVTVNIKAENSQDFSPN